MHTLNLTKLLSKQGLDPSKTYPAIVVDNDDPRQIGRIRARIDGLHEGIKDNELPWSIPKYEHCNGAFNKGDADVKRCGNFYVPKIDSKVCIQFPQNGDPHHSIYTGYTVDDETMLPESKVNYPDRAVVRFANGMFMIVDTKTNEIFINNPGDMHMTILGSVNQYVVGNQMLKVTNTMDDISPYLRNSPDSMLKGLKPNPEDKIKFEGVADQETGNQHTHIRGNQTLIVDGDQIMTIKGYQKHTISKGSECVGSQLYRKLKAGKIDFN